MSPWVGWLALGGLSSLSVSAFVGLLSFQTKSMDWQLLADPYLHHVVFFSLKQAALSALLSVGTGWPLARALYVLPHVPGKAIFLILCILCFVMPTLIVVTGLVILFGKAGVLAPMLEMLSGGHWQLYGLSGILLAHVYLNMPFVVRVLYLAYQSIPESSWKLARQLKLSPTRRAMWVEWRGVRQGVLAVSGMVFVLCFNSFAIVLALGGGPKSATLEVALYQALKYDFNMTEALLYAWVQLLIAGGAFALVARWGMPGWLGSSVREGSSPLSWRPRPGPFQKALLLAGYAAASLFLLAPIVAILVASTQVSLASLDWPLILRSLGLTLGLAFASAVLALGLSWCVLLPARRAARLQKTQKQLLLELWASHGLVLPAMVVSVGVFMLLLPRVDLDGQWPLWLLLVNVFLLVPFGVHKLRAYGYLYDQEYEALSRSLKLTFWQRLGVEWRYLRRPMLSALTLLFLLAVGDVAVFSIFGNYQWPTLPWLIYRYAGSYQLGAASVLSLLLLLFCFSTLAILSRTQRDRGHA